MTKRTVACKKDSPKDVLVSDAIIWLKNKLDKDIRALKKHHNASTQIATEYKGVQTELKKNERIIWGRGSTDDDKRKAIGKERRLGKSMWKLEKKHKRLVAYCDNKSRIFDIGLLFLSALEKKSKKKEAYRLFRRFRSGRLSERRA
jgi:hypothetical protein